jgi:hypothetical protein
VRDLESTNHQSQAPATAEETVTAPRDVNQDDGTPVPPRKVQGSSKKMIIESSDSENDDDQPSVSPIPPHKKARVASKKSNSKTAGNSHAKGASNDSEIEVIEKPQESPEKERGK